MNRKQCFWIPSCVGMTSVAVCLLLTASVHAKTITGEQAARVTGVLEACVAAVVSESDEAFASWTKVRGFVPVAYLSYVRWVAPEEDYTVSFGQRGDKPGRPFACEAVRNTGVESFLSGDRSDSHIVAWVNGLADVRLSGVRFDREAAFARAENVDALSACIAGQRLVLDAEITSKGAARIGVGVPLNEVLEC